MLGIKCFLFKEKRKNVSRKKVGFGLINGEGQGGRKKNCFLLTAVWKEECRFFLSLIRMIIGIVQIRSLEKELKEQRDWENGWSKKRGKEKGMDACRHPS
jgi:hypothetical protein